jgi:hypothetical protein
MFLANYCVKSNKNLLKTNLKLLRMLFQYVSVHHFSIKQNEYQLKNLNMQKLTKKHVKSKREIDFK